ncbi:FadR/GntR family transcriptional regulator [Rhodococcus globerulus]|uniref:GntR family transcriptional regulator n=1 Tax=Rhodococcus globerulus TaxID=33008 RepID=A0ABU4C4B4_RHOGO|nr:GntR family transcriptional regulator [Rhodococcus globerulus]MDV6271345.1 GntR family transcriptional regulator [Rhodococcus globerulus]
MDISDSGGDRGSRAPKPLAAKRTIKTAERTALAIVEEIVKSGLREGDRLPQETEMIAAYGVSRQSIKEALRILEVQGMVTLRPGPGGGVAVGASSARHLSRTLTLYLHFERTTYEDLIDAVVEMETLCSTLAARNPDRERKARLLRPFLDHDYPRAALEWSSGIPNLHQAIYQLADNEVLRLLTHSVTSTMEEHVMSTDYPTELRTEMLQEHRDIATAIIAGQSSKAARLTRKHFQDVADYYLAHWPDRLLENIEWR